MVEAFVHSPSELRERERDRETERERERLVNILKYVTKGTRSMGPGNQKLKS